MHISTPTQALPADAFLQEGIAAGSLAGDSLSLENKAHTKNQDGIFSKLLAALTGKAKSQLLPGELALPEELQTLAEQAEDIPAWPVSGPFNQAVGQSDWVSAYDSGYEPQASAHILDDQAGVGGALRQNLLAEQERGVQTDSQDVRSDSSAFSPYRDSLWRITAGNEGKYVPKKTGVSRDFGLFSGRFETGNPVADRAKIWGAEAVVTRYTDAEMTRPDIRPDVAGVPNGEGEESLLSELREKRGRFTIDVQDLRTPDTRPTAVASGVETYKGAGLDAAHTEIGINVDLKPSPHQGDGWAAKNNGREFSQSRLFEDALARELRGNLSTDIVKNASLIIRNGGEGTIRLALNPASLGHVKVHLEMTENKIIGHIIVESSEALRAFQRELPVLEKAFKDSGFMETSLDMSLAQEGRDFGAEQQKYEENVSVLDTALAASRYDAGTELVQDSSVSDNTVLSASSERKTVNLFI